MNVGSVFCYFPFIHAISSLVPHITITIRTVMPATNQRKVRS